MNEQQSTRCGAIVSTQFAVMGEISFTGDSSFSLDNGAGFLIKNDGEASVELEVRLEKMPADEFVETNFAVGWNPEIVKEIKKPSSTTGLDIKYGY